MRRWGLVTLGLGLGMAVGCLGPSPYVCASDGDCDRAGLVGRCLDDGACAYPSESCPSQWVRSPNAAVRPGACEPAGEDSGGATSTSGATTDPTSDPSGSSSGELPACGWLARLAVNTAFLSSTEVLEGYPLLLSIEAPELVAAIAASGEDPLITDTAGSPLASELEQLDEAAGTLALWVRLPSYALGESLALQLRFGGGESAGDPAAVWAERYVGVWHMAETPSGIDGDEIHNSVRPLEPGLTAGNMQPEQSVPGVVGRGLAFDGEDDVVTVDAEFVGQLDSYAITFWVRYDGAADGPGDYFQRLNGDYFYPRCWRQAGGHVFCQYIVDDTVTALGSGLDQAVGQRLHVALVRDAESATHRLYIDGELVGENEDPAGASLPDDGYPLELGRGELGTLPGMLDEVRVAAAPLSAAWVRADYRSQLEPGVALSSVGEAEPAPCPG